MSRRLPVSRSSSMYHTAFLALPLLVALGCSDTRTPTAPDSSMVPSHLLSDGSNGGDFEGFLFLPPLVAAPNQGGQTPIPGLAPHAEVCVLDTTGVCQNSEPFRKFGPSEIAFGGAHYSLQWDTRHPDYTVQTSTTYRLTVFLGSLQLGFIDLQFGANGSEAKNLATNQIVGLKDGRTVPVNFMIGSSLETDLADHGCFVGYDCQVATFTAGEEATIFTRDGDAVLHVPAGATTGSGTILVRIAELPFDPECLDKFDAPDPKTPYNSCYEYDLFPEQVFAAAVTVGQCIDTNSVPPSRIDVLQLGARHHGDAPANVPDFELLPNVAAPVGLSCNDYVPGPDPTGIAAALKDAGRNLAGLVFGTPVHAGHSGLGGMAIALSTVAWVDPGESLRIAGFDEQRGGVSSVSSVALSPAKNALALGYSTVSYSAASTLDAALLDEDVVDVVILGTVFDQHGAIAALTVDEQSALYDYVQQGGCAILLADHGTFSEPVTTAVNKSLLDRFGLSVTGTIGRYPVTATVTGTSAAVTGITSFLQGWPGWFNVTGQGTVMATNFTDGLGGPAMVEFAAGAFGPNSGPVFAFSDANAFLPENEFGQIYNAANQQLLRNMVGACVAPR